MKMYATQALHYTKSIVKIEPFFLAHIDGLRVAEGSISVRM